MLQMVTELLSGLALFLFGMRFMSQSLQRAAGDQMRGILNRVTKNRGFAVIFGALFTAVIQSSGATTVMEVSFVNAGLMSLEQSVGITFGANIGTTITSQLVSFRLTQFAPYIIFLGAIFMMFGKRPGWKRLSEIVFGFGALFLGINFMTNALSSIPEFPVIMHYFTYLDNYAVALLVGLVLTIIVQSSSVTVSVLVLLAGTGLVGMDSCLFFILGANIGSCTPAILAGLGSNREAMRTAMVHLLFNVLGMVVIGIILLFAMHPIVNLIASINGLDNANRFVANADTIFKIFQCIIFLPLSNQFVKLSGLLVRKKEKKGVREDDKSLQFIGKAQHFLPSTAVVEITQELERTAKIARTNVVESMEALMGDDVSEIETIEQREDLIDYLSREITDYTVEVNRYDLPLSDSRKIGALLHTVIDLERIGDYAMNFAESALKKKKHRLQFTEKGKNDIVNFYGKVLEIYDKSMAMFLSNNKGQIGEIIELENEIDRMDIVLQKKQVKRLSKKESSVEAGLIFTDTLIGLERIGDHSTNIAYSIMEGNPEDEY